MAIIRIKNNQDVADTYLGMEIAAGATYTLDTFDELKALTDSKLHAHINPAAQASVKATIFNDSLELSFTEAIKLLTGKSLQEVELHEEKSSDSIPLSTLVKSYTDKSKSFTSPDFSNRQSWFFDHTQVTDEVMTSTDDIVYTSTRTPNAGWDHDWLNWKKIPNHIRQTTPEVRPVVKVNDVVVTSGITIDYQNGTVTFASANSGTDVVKVSYRYGNSSRFDLTALEGTKLLVDYVETQFSVGCQMPENGKLLFQAIYNGPAVPALGIPANYDIILATYEYYSGADFLNESNQAYQVTAFMELTKDVNILPWNYLTGHTIKSPGCPTTDISKNEFNKLRLQMVDIDGGPDQLVTDCEISTGTIYAMIRDV